MIPHGRVQICSGFPMVRSVLPRAGAMHREGTCMMKSALSWPMKIPPFKHLHPEGTSNNSDNFKRFWLQFTMVVYEKIYLRAKINNPTLHTAETHFLLENLWISVASTGVLEKFQHSSDLPDANYDYVVLFLGQMYWLFIYAPKYLFS